jgi:phosphomannomutase
MLKFGTSGLRGLVTELTDQECYRYTTAFLQYLSEKNLTKKNSVIAIAGDFRPSTERILEACIAAIRDYGLQEDYCGLIPTPTVSLHGFNRKIPSIMVTGSHIPYDRNGIKFNLPDGEILKSDEQAISQIYQTIRSEEDINSLFDKKGSSYEKILLPEVNDTARKEYIERYLNFFGNTSLSKKTIVVYQHSSVIRDIIVEVLEKLGAHVIPVDRSDEFIPIDTEAMRDIDLKNALLWADKFKPDAIVSADGDGDRPLLFDEIGNFIRGDLLGVLSSAYLEADSVSVTASSNTAVERSGKFSNVRRTKIGSPFVIEGMNEALKEGYKRVVSFEANGGYLTGSELIRNGNHLTALPTRDSMLPILSTLSLSIKQKLSLSKLLTTFPKRFVFSHSLKDFLTEKSLEILETISGDVSKAKAEARKIFGLPSDIQEFNFTDGARMFLSNGEIVHVRPSGNAPELRVYVEADTFERAKELGEHVLKILRDNTAA